MTSSRYLICLFTYYYSYVSDVARRIDEETAACKSIPNLFHTNIEVQRQKLRDNCEKLMFLDPLNYGKRALELLWRKVYYDTVSTAKKLQNLDEDYDNFLFTHIMCGIGQFHQMITKIQSESKVQFKELDYVSLQKEEEFEGVSTLHGDLEQWARSAIHSCLIYLGDLSRYQAEIFHTFDPSIAARYYLQAAHINFSSGMPYNQLGNLYMDKSHNLNSVCYYIHCLSCTLPFEGAMGNLTKLFEKNSQLIETFKSIEAVDLTQVEHIQGAVSNFLSLIEIWYLGKEDPDIPQRCNMLAQDLKVALNLTKIPLPDINKNYDEYVQATEDENINPSYINTNMMQEIVQICIFTVAKVSETDDKRAFGAKAFTLAVLSQLLQKLLQQLQQCGFKNPAAKYQKRYMSVQVEEITEPPKEEVECTNESSVMNGDADGCKETSIEINDEPIEINEEIVPEIVENGEIKNVKKNSTKRRRRRRVMSSSSSEVTDSDTDISDDAEHVSSNEEGNNSDSTAHSDCRSEHSDDDFSETESVADVELNGTNEELNNNNKKTDLQNGEPIKNSLEDNAIDDSDSLNINEIQNFLRGNNFLPSIKLLQDWILQEKDLILSCGESGESLFQCIVDLLNILEFYFKPKHSNDLPENCKILDYARCVAKSLELDYRRIPLPEDVSLRGTNICKFDTHAAEWNVLNQYQPSVYEENVLRILNFIDFGHQIAKIVPRIRYNRTLQIFYLKKITAPKLNTKLTHKRSREWHYSKMHVSIYFRSIHGTRPKILHQEDCLPGMPFSIQREKTFDYPKILSNI